MCYLVRPKILLYNIRTYIFIRKFQLVAHLGGFSDRINTYAHFRNKFMYLNISFNIFITTNKAKLESATNSICCTYNHLWAVTKLEWVKQGFIKTVHVDINRGRP